MYVVEALARNVKLEDVGHADVTVFYRAEEL